VNIPLERLIDGIIATMRSDVIPHVRDSYARGQAVGVIDLLNNIAPRVEWAQAPLAQLVAAKRALVAEIAALDLLTAKRRLDAAIGDAIAVIWPRRDEAAFGRLAAHVSAHLHDEMAAEMKITRKPLFAEIASGGDGNG
jgi:hypothetical protein